MAVRRQRESVNLPQKELGARLRTSQPRIAKLERAATDVSLDHLVKAFAAAGGKIVVKVARATTKPRRSTKRALSARVVVNALTSK